MIPRRLLDTSILSAWLFGFRSVVCSSCSITDVFPTLYVAHQNRSVLTIHFDPTKAPEESLEIVQAVHAGFQPGWLCTHDSNLYAVSRSKYPDSTSPSGGIFAFAHTQSSGLVGIGDTTSDGEGGVFCDISKDGRVLSVANILAQPGPGTNGSQIQSNPHQAVFDPSGQLMIVPDRGADRVYFYRVSSISDLGLDVALAQNITLPPGSGPRHAIFQVINDRATMMYLVGELDNTIRAFLIGDTASSLTLNITMLQIVSTLGPGAKRTDPNNEHLASEVALSTDGRFLYVSNRNTVSYDADPIAIFALQPSDTKAPLTYLGQNSTLGKIPRHFSLSQDPENKWVAVANEVSNNILLFKRNRKSGFLEDGIVGNLTLGDFDISLERGPMAVIWG
ncbi:hypothetical protein JX265_005609 [Neoarthrinium moseri]|uniref:3-carboxymuconate cyclase n=1 Tax=Neoarthrinium moseri TaxID=1658444 RepID=A0A9P9WN52_9PEZI|nr:hypothetical protein JX265_005609 [Neoarthrinium moseri]